MKKKFHISRPLAAGALGVALALTMTLFTVMANAEPYVGIGGSEIRVVWGDDGTPSYQLLVDVAVGNVPDSGLFTYLTAFLDFNNNYLRPSNLEDNSLFDADPNDYERNGNPCFRPNPELNFTDPYGQEQGPFQIFAHEDIVSTSLGEESQLVGLNWGLKTLYYPDHPDFTVSTDMLGTWSYYGDDTKSLYIDAVGKEKVLLGQISFRIEEAQIANVLKNFDDKDLTDTDGRLDNGDYLIRFRRAGETTMSSDPVITTLATETDPDTGMVIFLEPSVKNLDRRVVQWDFDPDSLMDARAAEEEVTINAYQAFGEGTPWTWPTPWSVTAPRSAAPMWMAGSRTFPSTGAATTASLRRSPERTRTGRISRPSSAPSSGPKTRAESMTADTPLRTRTATRWPRTGTIPPEEKSTT